MAAALVVHPVACNKLIGGGLTALNPNAKVFVPLALGSSLTNSDRFPMNNVFEENYASPILIGLQGPDVQLSDPSSTEQPQYMISHWQAAGRLNAAQIKLIPWEERLRRAELADNSRDRSCKYFSPEHQLTIMNDLQLSLLAAEFPNFAVKSMAEVLYVNDGDLMLTREMLKEEEAIPWLQTGDAVASLYADTRKEAADHALARNAYFEQARQANDAGNKALASELTAKGSWHNEQMKAAHSKAAEAIFIQRNPLASRQRKPTLLDMHGLHVNEAILILKRELAAIKRNCTSNSNQKRQQLFICVGTGHHSRTGAKLPSAIARYLLEDEHLYFTETRPGMLRVIL